jgi:hypothetical protein
VDAGRSFPAPRVRPLPVFLWVLVISLQDVHEDHEKGAHEDRGIHAVDNRHAQASEAASPQPDADLPDRPTNRISCMRMVELELSGHCEFASSRSVEVEQRQPDRCDPAPLILGGVRTASFDSAGRSFAGSDGLSVKFDLRYSVSENSDDAASQRLR